MICKDAIGTQVSALMASVVSLMIVTEPKLLLMMLALTTSMVSLRTVTEPKSLLTRNRLHMRTVHDGTEGVRTNKEVLPIPGTGLWGPDRRSLGWVMAA